MRKVTSMYSWVGSDNRTVPFWVGGSWRDVWRKSASSHGYMDFAFRQSRYHCDLTMDTWLSCGPGILRRVPWRNVWLPDFRWSWAQGRRA